MHIIMSSFFLIRWKPGSLWQKQIINALYFCQQRRLIKHKKGIKLRSKSELPLGHPFKLQRAKLSSSPQLLSPSAPSTSLYNYAHMPHHSNISSLFPDTASGLSVTPSPQNPHEQSLESPQALHVQPSLEMQTSAPKSPLSQPLHLKTFPVQRTLLQGVDPPKSPQTLESSIQGTELSDSIVKPTDCHDISMNSPPVIRNSSSPSSLDHLTQSVSGGSNSTDTESSHSSVSSLSSSDLSQSPTSLISTPLPFSKEEEKPLKNTGKVSTLYTCR